MSTQTLATVANHVVTQYSAAGKTLNHAYCTGVERVLANTKVRFVSALEARPLPLLNTQVKTQLVNVQSLLAGFMLKGTQNTSKRADQAIDMITARATSGIASVEGAVTRAAASVKFANLDKVRSLNAPIAKLATQIADKVAEGAKAVEARIGGVAEEVKEVAVAAKPARRAARKA